ncbi:hypothetical protein C8R42DRAFT_329566 [Lentinula raphanica]|nr:hypothetical protein C8R42DRAFT_329566 [Lentinula raphanica]
MSSTSEDLSPSSTFRHRTRLNADKDSIDCEPSAASLSRTRPASTSKDHLLSLESLYKHKLKLLYILIFALSSSALFLLFSTIHAVTNYARPQLQQSALIEPNHSLSKPDTTVESIRKVQISRPLSNASSHEIEASSPNSKTNQPASTRSGAVPVVYRTVLEKLDQLDRQQQVLAALPESVPFLNIETEYYNYDESSVAALCRDSPCRFLLPLRIAEQESKARIHLLEIIQTAKRLDRILVLPRAGKSRLGLCFRWSFEAYYDEDLLQTVLQQEGVRAVTQEAFKHWLDSSPSERLTRGQLVSLASKAKSDSTGTVIFGDDNGLTVSVDTKPIQTQDPRLPGCFRDRFGMLLSGDFIPLSIYPSLLLSKSLKRQAIGEEFVSIFGREDIRNASRSRVSPDDEPEVLMLDWDMRHPIYSQPFIGSITYSPLLEHLAGKVSSPSSPYLMIHWRMESVSPVVLPDCAHALVDTISDLLLTSELGEGVQKVWFAGDYPVPISNHLYPPSSDRAPITTTIQNKSGTFRDFGEKHREAVDILVDAFREGAELDRWSITDLAAELLRMENGEVLDVHPDFMTDSGALGILDKMIGMNAAIFVGGSKRCGRTSSFTKQVIDSRQKDFDKDGKVRNVVEYFG